MARPAEFVPRISALAGSDVEGKVVIDDTETSRLGGGVPSPRDGLTSGAGANRSAGADGLQRLAQRRQDVDLDQSGVDAQRIVQASRPAHRCRPRRPSVHQVLASVTRRAGGQPAPGGPAAPLIQVSTYLTVLPAGPPDASPMAGLTSDTMRAISPTPAPSSTGSSSTRLRWSDLRREPACVPR